MRARLARHSLRQYPITLLVTATDRRLLRKAARIAGRSMSSFYAPVALAHAAETILFAKAQAAPAPPREKEPVNA